MPSLLTPRPFTATTALCAGLLAWTSCGGAVAEPEASRGRPAPVVHDFGTIPHGELRSEDLELTIPGGGAGMVPETLHVSCSCARWTFWIRGTNGELRRVDHRPRPFKVLQAGERLVLRLTIDTTMKEPVDQKRTTIKAGVRLRDAESSQPPIYLPVTFSFAIAARVDVHPVAHVDFRTLARSQTYEETLELRPRRPDTELDLGGITTTDPRLTAKGRRETGADDERLFVDLRFVPARAAGLGPVRAKIRIPTNLDGYVLEIPVSGIVTPNVVVEGTSHMSFGGFDLADPAHAPRCSALITDHDGTRSADFTVYSITDTRGVSLADHFAVHFENVDGKPRSRRLLLEYRGGLSGNGFRGELKLAKPGQASPITTLTFVGFQQRR